MFMLASFLLLALVGLVIALFVITDRMGRLTYRIARLESELDEFRRSYRPVSRDPDVTAKVAFESSGPAKVEHTAEPPSVLGRPMPIPPPPPHAPEAPSRPLRETPPPVQKQPSRSQQEWEQLIGGKLLNRIGALALIIGVGFFLKYAFDNDWISESVRVAFGVVLGFGILALGLRSRTRGFQIFSQGLFGAGIAILYLSIYASFNFYHLLPQPVAFAAMAIITAIALSLASRFDSLAIAFLGWGGGFLTPFLLSTGQANAPGLFGYLALLNLGLLVTVYRKRGWDILAPLSLAATAVIFFSWRDAYYQTSDLSMAIGFLVLVWAEYTGHHALCLARKIPNNPPRYIAACLNVAVLFIGLVSVVESRDWEGITAALMAAAYLGLYIATRKHLVGDKITEIVYLVAMMAVAAAAVVIRFNGFEIIIGWSILAAVFIAGGLYWMRRLVVQGSLVLLALTGMGLLTIDRSLVFEPIDTFALIANERAIAFVIFAATLGGCAFLLRRSKDPEDDQVRPFLQTACAVVIFVLITVETLDYFRHLMIGQDGLLTSQSLQFRRDMSVPSLWALFSLPVLWYGLIKRSIPVATVALGTGAIAVLYLIANGLSYSPIQDYSFPLNIRVAATLLILGAVLVQSRLLAMSGDSFPQTSRMIDAARIAAVLLGLFLMTVETWDIFERSMAATRSPFDTASSKHESLRNLQQLTLSGLWLLYSMVMMALGLWRRKRAIRFVAIGLFGVSILKIFTYDLSFLDTLYRIFSFIGLGVILLAVSYVYQKYKEIILGSHDPA